MVLHIGTKRVIIKIIFGPLVKGFDRVKELAVRKLGRGAQNKLRPGPLKERKEKKRRKCTICVSSSTRKSGSPHAVDGGISLG
jgi:hypothetical protein